MDWWGLETRIGFRQPGQHTILQLYQNCSGVCKTLADGLMGFTGMNQGLPVSIHQYVGWYQFLIIILF